MQNQLEVGVDGYDAGADILYGFFRRELPKFLEEDLDPEGRRIIECCLDGGTLEDYLATGYGIMRADGSVTWAKLRFSAERAM